MRRAIVLTTLGVLAVISAGAADEPKLVKPKLILADDGKADVPKFMHSARLSPDGKHLLYMRVKRVQFPAQASHPAPQRRSYRLILRELKTGKDKPLPIPAYMHDWMAMAMISDRVFGLGGKKIALGAGQDTNGNGLYDYNTEKMHPAVYDIASGKLTKLPVTGSTVLATFDRTGKGLIMLIVGVLQGKLLTTPLDKPKLRQLGKWGRPRGVCPSADVLALLLPPDLTASASPKFVKLILYDLKGDKQITKLPPHEGMNDLEECCPRWTTNGRYLYYADTKYDVQGKRTERKDQTRIWDRTKGREAGIVADVVPIGPGPGKTTMVIAKDRGRGQISLHDAATGDSHPLGKETMNAIAAEGKYLLYADKPADGKSGIYMAEIVPAKKDKPAGKKEADAVK